MIRRANGYTEDMDNWIDEQIRNNNKSYSDSASTVARAIGFPDSFNRRFGTNKTIDALIQHLRVMFGQTPRKTRDVRKKESNIEILKKANMLLVIPSGEIMGFETIDEMKEAIVNSPQLILLRNEDLSVFQKKNIKIKHDIQVDIS